VTKESRIKRELSRLRKIYKGLPEDQKKLSAGLIERAAYLRVSLEDLEEDMDQNGYVELFTQSERLEPYERERPAARLYANLVAKYAAIHKQLSNLLADKPDVSPVDDFESF
jgi:hypothetical protein